MKDGKYQYRDTKGNLSEESFETFVDAEAAKPETLTYKFFEEIDIYALSSKEILENLDKIKRYLKDEYQRVISACSTKEQMQKVVEYYKEQAEYIKTMAYEEYENQKNIDEFYDIKLF